MAADAVQKAKKVEPQKHRVLIVDDHPLIQSALSEMISAEPDLEVCGMTGSLQEAVNLAQEARPHLAVVDLSLEDGNGIELINRFAELVPHMHVIVLSLRDESFYAERAVSAGALGYVHKRESPEAIMEAIRRAIKGEAAVGDEFVNRVVQRLSGKRANEKSGIHQLSDRELEVFEYIGQGLTTAQIADRLCLSQKTIETYRGRIKDKLLIDSHGALIVEAVKWYQYKVTNCDTDESHATAGSEEVVDSNE